MAVDQPGDASGSDGALTPSVVARPHSRRAFLRTGTIGTAAAGVLAFVPGISGLLTSASADAPAASGAASEAEAAAPEVSGPIVAHITDAASGDLNIYVGRQQLAYHDPVLVQHLIRAAASG